MYQDKSERYLQGKTLVYVPSSPLVDRGLTVHTERSLHSDSVDDTVSSDTVVDAHRAVVGSDRHSLG